MRNMRKLQKKTEKQRSGQRSNFAILSDDKPFGYIEAYKSLRTSLLFMAASKGYKRIIVTSSLPAEGKSTVSINLAITLAEAGKKVVVVECDLRRPMLQRYLRMQKRGVGLSYVLSGLAPLKDAIVPVEGRGFSLIPSGVVPPNPSELLDDDRMAAVADELSEMFDFVIFDSAPISVVTDAAVLCKYADGILMVVRHKFASRKAVIGAKKRLEAVGGKVIGAIISQYDVKKSTRGPGYYSSYNYSYAYGYGYANKNRSSGHQSGSHQPGGHREHSHREHSHGGAKG